MSSSEHQNAPPEPHLVEGVHGSHIAAAHLSDIQAFAQFADDISRRERAYQISQNQGQGRIQGIHSLKV